MMKLWIIAVLAVVVTAIIITLVWLLPFSSKPRVCSVAVFLEGRGSYSLSNSSGLCGFRAQISVYPGEGWRLSNIFVNGSRVEAKTSLSLVVNGNTTVHIVLEPIPVTLKILSNVSKMALLNGSEVELPYTKTYPYGTTLVIEPASLEGYRRLTNTTVIKLTSNTTLWLNYTKRRIKPRVYRAGRGDYVLWVTSSVNEARVRVQLMGGYNATWYNFTGTLEYRFEKKYLRYLYVEGAFEVPYNQTHSWWLAWYNISYPGGSEVIGYTYRWSKPRFIIGVFYKVNTSASSGCYMWECWEKYGVPGESRYRLGRMVPIEANNTKITLYYVLGLKQLPWVLRVYKWPWYVWDERANTYHALSLEIRDWSLVTTDFNPKEPPGTNLILWLGQGIKNIYVEVILVNDTDRRENKVGFSLIPLDGSTVIEYGSDIEFEEEVKILIGRYYHIANISKQFTDADINYKVYDWDLGKQWFSNNPVPLPNTGRTLGLYIAVGNLFGRCDAIIIRILGVAP